MLRVNADDNFGDRKPNVSIGRAEPFRGNFSFFPYLERDGVLSKRIIEFPSVYKGAQGSIGFLSVSAITFARSDRNPFTLTVRLAAAG